MAKKISKKEANRIWNLDNYSIASLDNHGYVIPPIEVVATPEAKGIWPKVKRTAKGIFGPSSAYSSWDRYPTYAVARDKYLDDHGVHRLERRYTNLDNPDRPNEYTEYSLDLPEYNKVGGRKFLSGEDYDKALEFYGKKGYSPEHFEKNHGKAYNELMASPYHHDSGLHRTMHRLWSSLSDDNQDIIVNNAINLASVIPVSSGAARIVQGGKAALAAGKVAARYGARRGIASAIGSGAKAVAKRSVIPAAKTIGQDMVVSSAVPAIMRFPENSVYGPVAPVANNLMDLGASWRSFGKSLGIGKALGDHLIYRDYGTE